jgi:hypothetical protein
LQAHSEAESGVLVKLHRGMHSRCSDHGQVCSGEEQAGVLEQQVLWLLGQVPTCEHFELGASVFSLVIWSPTAASISVRSYTYFFLARWRFSDRWKDTVSSPNLGVYLVDRPALGSTQICLSPLTAKCSCLGFVFFVLGIGKQMSQSCCQLPDSPASPSPHTTGSVSTFPAVLFLSPHSASIRTYLPATNR